MKPPQPSVSRCLGTVEISPSFAAIFVPFIDTPAPFEKMLSSLNCSFLIFLTTISHFPALISPSPLASRAQTCDNAPLTVAGTLLDRHADRLVLPRAQPKNFLWCVPSTQTYVTPQVALPVAAGVLNALMDNAYNSVFAHI